MHISHQTSRFRLRTRLTALPLGLLLGLLAALLTACAPKAVVHSDMDLTFVPCDGDFISPYGQRMTLDQILEMARGKDYVLIGEGHRNLCDHNIQQRVVAALAASDTPPAIGLEMVGVDKQPILDDFAKGQVEPGDLAEELEWRTRWGYPFSLFRPLFVVAQRNSLPVAGLNLPPALVRKISREGLDSLTGDERAMLPARIIPPGREQMPMLEQILAMHEGRNSANATQRESFLLTQSLWDSKMAEEAVRLRAKYHWPVVILAGSGHVEHGWGIARRIRFLDPGATMLKLMPYRGGPLDDEAGDAFFSCPDTYKSRMGALLAAVEDGLEVRSVERGSRAAMAGLRPGDLLLEASGVPLHGLMALHLAGTKVHDADEELVFVVRRGGRTFHANVGKLGTSRPAPPEPPAGPKPEPDNEPTEQKK